MNDLGAKLQPVSNFTAQEQALMNVLGEHFSGVYFIRSLEGFIHNLNSPLQILWIRSEQIQQDILKLEKALQQTDNPEIREIVERLQQRLGSLEKGMDDLNSSLSVLSKDVVVKRQSEIGPVYLNDVINDAFSLLKADMFFKHQVETKLKLHDNLTKLTGRYSDFCVVALHLLQNALEAMTQCEEKCLVVETDMEGDQVVLRVRDTGHGISSDMGAHLFEPFFTTKETFDYNGQTQQHAGLGLCHASHLMARYDGKISFESNDRETVFTVTVPCSS